MAHEVETIAYANDTPWHGLGNRVDPSISIEEMTVQAGLDWTVDLCKIYAEGKDGSKIALPLRRALVRSSDNKVLTVCGDYWNPLQNRDAMEFFREYAESGGAHLEVAGSLRGGKIIWALARINRGFKVLGRAHDAMHGYILLSSPHEVGKSIKVRTTATRVVCANTLALAERDAVQYRQGHGTAFNASAAKASIQLAEDQIGQMEIQANKLAKVQLSTFDTLRILAANFQPAENVDKQAQSLIDNPESRNLTVSGIMSSITRAPGAEPETAWGVLNGVTHYFDHVIGRNPETRLANSWFGTAGTKKTDVLTDLLALV